MKHIRSLFPVISVLAGGVIASAQPLHLEAGLELADEIAAAQTVGIYTDASNVALNRYGGSWGSATDASFIRFADPAAGVLPGNNTRCAPLVTHLLKFAYNWNWKNYSFYDSVLKATKSTASPAPYQYVQLIKDRKGFSGVTRLDAAAAGDVLCWWKVGSDSNDHAMLIVSIDWDRALGYPSDQTGADATLTGTTYVEVEVLDSSSGVHTADTRLVNVNGVDTQIPGIGTGKIGLLVNASREIVGYTWSLPTSAYGTSGWLNGLHSRLKRTPEWEIVIGRFSGAAN